MEVRLGKWEKSEIKRIYFNHISLGSAKAYAYSGENDQCLIRYERHGKTTVRQIMNVIEAASKAIEEKIGDAIGYNTKFADVWEAVK
jgi:hypothetical protein